MSRLKNAVIRNESRIWYEVRDVGKVLKSQKTSHKKLAKIFLQYFQADLFFLENKKFLPNGGGYFKFCLAELIAFFTCYNLNFRIFGGIN